MTRPPIQGRGGEVSGQRDGLAMKEPQDGGDEGSNSFWAKRARGVLSVPKYRRAPSEGPGELTAAC
jgi:hypothetical protein